MKIFVLAIVFLSLHATSHSRLVSDEQAALLKKYQMDSSYIKEFPFSKYRIVESQSQGKFYVDGSDYIKNTLASNRTWEPQIVGLIRKYVKPGTVVIDIGAHIGTHAITMSQSVKEGVVIAFEPQAKIHRELVMNLRLNRCDNVLRVQSAVGEKDGFAYLEPLRSYNEGYRSISSKRPMEKVPLVTLDSFGLTSVSFIKIDVESYELEVLQGAYETIMKNKPVMIIEIGGGKAREQEENIDSKKHLADVIGMLENVFHYQVTPISLSTGDYLAIPFPL